MASTGSAQPSLLTTKVVAAGSSAVVAGLLCTPFDVLRVRLQTPVPEESVRSSSETCRRRPVGRVYSQGHALLFSPRTWFFQRPLVRLLRSQNRPQRYHCQCLLTLAPCTQQRARPGMVQLAQGIVKQEGLPMLWRGLDLSLLATVPQVAIYMPMYDLMLEALSRPSTASASQASGDAPHTSAAALYAPGVAAALARALAVLSVAPLELARTRVLATMYSGSGGSQPSAWSALRTLAQESGGGLRLQAVQSMWRGCGATLARDVPFSALYFSTVEPLRRLLLSDSSPRSAALVGADNQGVVVETPAPTASRVFAVNLAAGASAGAAAAALTTPFDVAKTRLMTAQQQQRPRGQRAGGGVAAWLQRPGSTTGVLHSVWRAEGMRGLFAGMVPRAARAAPACSIVIASYEVLKL